MTVKQNQINCEDLKAPLKKRKLQVSKLDNDIIKEEVNNLQETKDTSIYHENVEAEEKLSGDACKNSEVIIDQDKLSNLNKNSESCLSQDIKEFAKLLENVETEEIDKIILQSSSNEIENFPVSPTKIFEEIDELKPEICMTEDESKPQQIFNTHKTPKKEITTPFPIKNEKNEFFFDTFNALIDNTGQKYNSISDHKIIKDTVKSELYDPVNSDDFEAMDLLSDLKTAMNFENVCDMDKTSEVLLPTITCDDVAQGEHDNTTEFIEDPSQDPLFIDTDEEINTMKTRSMTLSQPRSQLKKTEHFEIKTSPKYKNKKLKDEPYVEVTEILKELKNIEIKDKSENAANRLSKLEIKLIHDVPPQHKIKYNIGRKEKLAKGKSLAQYGPIRRGKFSASEDEIIMNNWKMFCEVHNWNSEDMKPFLYPNNKGKYCMNLEKKYKFMQFLANGLPWRLLDSVHQRFVKLGRKHINNTFRTEQNKRLITYMEKKVHNEERLSNYCDILEKRGYEGLAKVLKKNHSILKKRNSARKNDFTKPLVKVTWTLPRIAKFIKILLKATLSEDLEELKNAVIPNVIWMKLQKKLNIHHHVLRRFWVFHLHMQLFYPYPIYQNDIKIQLIEYMYEKGISDKKEIEWNNVAKHFDGITSTCLARTFRQLTQRVISRGVGENFIDIVEYLYETKIPALKKCSGDLYLPRIKYKNGKVRVINHDEGDNTEDNSTSDDNISITNDSITDQESNNDE